MAKAMSEEDQKSLARNLNRKLGLVLQPEVVTGPVGSDNASPLAECALHVVKKWGIMPQVLASVQNESSALVRVLEKRELLL
jgi:hypothetical protein